MERKGLSQILYLIIAASVLMMVAMVLTFTATDVLTGTGQGATERQCIEVAESQCDIRQADYVDLPPGCVNENNNLINALPSADVEDKDGSGDCETSGSGGVKSGCEYVC
jgi:hypothetical protein